MTWAQDSWNRAGVANGEAPQDAWNLELLDPYALPTRVQLTFLTRLTDLMSCFFRPSFRPSPYSCGFIVFSITELSI